MYKKILILLLCLLLLLCGCGKDNEAEPEEPVEPVEEAYEATDEELAGYVNTWVYQTGQNADDYIYRLTLNKDMTVSLPMKDSNGDLVDLSGGTWEMTGKDELTLSLTTTTNDGEELSEENYFDTGGTYKAVLTDDQGLELSPKKDADHIISHMQFGPIILYPEDIYFEENTSLEPLPEVSDEELCDAALRHYESVTGHSYPGIADVDSVSEDGYLIHIYENMETHTATAAWYLINPYTYQGTNDITGEKVDLTPFLFE